MGTLFTGLGVAAALSVTDIIPVHQGGARAVGLTGAQLLTYVGGSYVAKTGAQSMAGPLAIASGTLTASTPALSITQTWNNAAEAFTGLLMNVTNTASSSGSRVFNLQVAGTSIFSVRADGYSISSTGMFVGSGGTNGLWDPAGPRVKSTGYFSWAQSTNATDTADLFLYRDAAATLAQRNGTTQQIFRLYNTADAGLANYERLTLTGVAGTSVNITAETLGTGADNLDIVLTPAGTGNVKFGTLSQIVVSTGSITGQNVIVYGTAVGKYAAGLRAGSTGELAFTSGADTDAVDTALMRNAAGVVEVNNGTAATYRDLKLRNLIQTEYSQLTEMTAPAAPAANSVRIYAVDNGAGKTRLMALFATGSAVQIAIEP